MIIKKQFEIKLNK